MDTTELRDTFRAEFFDTAVPYLVSDQLIYAYIDEAQKKFCRLTEGIEDGRSFTISVVPGTIWYTLDPRILKIRSLTDVSTGHAVELVSMESAALHGFRLGTRLGPLVAMVAGAEKGTLRACPVPNASVELQLNAFRLPHTVEAGDDLEIDEQHHLALLMWVKHKAYSIHDAETYDRTKAAEYESNFRRYCAEARTEQNRARHSAGVVAYGGI